MIDLEKALECPTPRLDNDLIDGESLYLIIPDFVLDVIKDAARRFANLTSDENVEKAAIAIMETLEARNASGDPWAWDDMNDEARAERLEEAAAAIEAALASGR